MIGSGSFSTVYRARQPALDRVVAVKVLKVALTDPASEASFRDECTAAGRLSDHPNIVTVHGSGVLADHRPYIVMAHYRGGSLADRPRASMGLVEVLRIGVKLSGALHAAHVAGVLHCDVKPANVLVSHYGEPMLGDFGIASIRLGGAASTLLTPNFAAPEVLVGGPASQASDAFALAATLYVLLCGETPHRQRPGETMEALGARVRVASRPSLVHPEVDAAVARTLTAPLHPDPAARPRSALRFGRSLQEIQERLGLGVTDLPGFEDDADAPRLDRRRPRPTGAPSPPTPLPPAPTPLPRAPTPLPPTPATLPPAPPISAERSSARISPAPVGLRAQAMVVDLAASVSITAVATLIAQVGPDAPAPSVASSAAAAAVGLACFHTVFAALIGPTPGRWWAGLTLARAGVAGRVPWWVALWRTVVGAGSTVLLGAGYLAALSPPGATWSDVASATDVVRAAERPPAPWLAGAAAVATSVSGSLAVILLHVLGAP